MHLVSLEGHRAGDPHLHPGKPGFDGGNHPAQQAHVLVGLTVISAGLGGDQEQQEAVIFRKKIGFLAQVAEIPGKPGVKGRHVRSIPGQMQIQLPEGGS